MCVEGQSGGAGSGGPCGPPLSCGVPCMHSAVSVPDTPSRLFMHVPLSAPTGLPRDPAGRFSPYSDRLGSRASGGARLLSEGSAVREPQSC